MENDSVRIRKFQLEDIRDILSIEQKAFPKSVYSRETFLHFAAEMPDTWPGYIPVPITSESENTLAAGDNTIAIHANQGKGKQIDWGQCIDAGLLLVK